MKRMNMLLHERSKDEQFGRTQGRLFETATLAFQKDFWDNFTALSIWNPTALNILDFTAILHTLLLHRFSYVKFSSIAVNSTLLQRFTQPFHDHSQTP